MDEYQVELSKIDDFIDDQKDDFVVKNLKLSVLHTKKN